MDIFSMFFRHQAQKIAKRITCPHENWSFVIDGCVSYFQCDDCDGISKTPPIMYKGVLRTLLPLCYPLRKR